MAKDEKPKGRLTRRLACPTCGGRLRKIESGNYACDGECKETYEQMKLWESEKDEI